MIFVINNLKYDTDKMELISDECEYWYKGELLGTPIVYSINYDNLLDAAAIYFTRFERYIVHYILLSNHVLTRHVVFLLYWSRYGGNEVENG